MKRFIVLMCAVSCVLASCTEGGEGVPTKPKLESLTIEGNLNELSYDIGSYIDQEERTITLDKHVADGTRVIFTFEAAGSVYCGDVEMVSGISGVDLTKNSTLTVKSGAWKPLSYTFVIPNANEGEGLISGFSLRLTKNGSPANYTGTIDQTKRAITVNIPGVDWIDDISSAVAEFTSDGESVKVDGVAQVSGVTLNNFMTDVVYTVSDVNGNQRDYKVDVISPQSSGLPVVRIDTEGEAPILNKEDYVVSHLTISDGNNPENNIVEALAEVRGRGNSTWGYDKKPYRVKLDKKASVFGLTSAKNWVLLANWQDPTHLMNTVAFELAHRLGMAFAPTTTHVEFFLNGAYRGTYTMCEHIQVNEGRVDIDEFEDVFLELDSYMDEANQFYSTGLGMPVMFKSPEFEDVPDAERNAFIADVKSDFDAMESAVMSLSDWRDRIDVRSFIDFMIVNELTRNAELYHPKSTYVHKVQGGKWTWGPVWDFDWGYGYSGWQNYWDSPTGLVFVGQNTDSRPGAIFFNRLFENADFRREYKARWNAVEAQLGDIEDFVAEMGALLAESDMHNKKVWDYQYTKNYQQQIEAMQTWLRQRIAALNAKVGSY